MQYGPLPLVRIDDPKPLKPWLRYFGKDSKLVVIYISRDNDEI